MSQGLNNSKDGITVYPFKHPAKEWIRPLVNSNEYLMEYSCPEESKKSKQILRSSFENHDESSLAISASSHGFVYAAFEAYCGHHHLIIRPEDIWFAILTQLSFYVNANAEELRHHFVAHEGQKEVEVKDVGTIYTVDIGRLAIRLTGEMDKFIVDRELKDWILPNFTTTTPTDTVVAAVLMMGAMQAYFKYLMSLECGIPSVTLLGAREDWVSIRLRLDKLASFGEQSQQFGELLKPVLDNFVKTFDSNQDDFWAKICHYNAGGSGLRYLSGWISAFCFWNNKGELIKSRQSVGSRNVTVTGGAGREYRSSPYSQVEKDDITPPTSSQEGETFDSSIYPWINTNDIPDGFSSVPVKVDDNGKIYLTRMIAGSVGMQWTRSSDPFELSVDHRDRESFRGESWQWNEKTRTANGLGLDTVKPVLGWWMYELKDSET